MGRLISTTGLTYLQALLQENTITQQEYDITILADERDDPNIFLGYWTLRSDDEQGYCKICQCHTASCRYPDRHQEYWVKRGLQLYKWQIDIMMGNLVDTYGNPAHTVVVSGGPGCGKSTLLAAATATWCALNPGFISMCPAPTSEQNTAVHRELVKHFTGTRYEEVFMEDKFDARSVSGKPIAIDWNNGSSLHLFTTSAFAGAASSGKKNLGREGDVGIYDEAGIDSRFGSNLQVLGTRMRGTRPDGSPRGIVYPNGDRIPMMLLISNPNPENVMWDEFVSYVSSAKGFALKEVSSSDNKAITPEQNLVALERVMAAVTIQHGDIDDAYAILAGRQESVSGGEVFQKTTIQRAVDPEYSIGDYITRELYDRRGTGNFTFNIPPIPGHVYAISMDPGVALAPRRNAPAIGVWDITNLYNCVLVGLHWGAITEGVPTHSLVQLREWVHLYSCRAALDTTGAQYLIFGRTEVADVKERLIGFQFGGDNKLAHQIAMRDDLTDGYITLPNYTYFRRQMRNYTFADNKKSNPQDLVSMILVFCAWRRTMVSGDKLREAARKQAEELAKSRDVYVRHRSHPKERRRL